MLMIFQFTLLAPEPRHVERPAAPFEAKRAGPWDEDQKRHLKPGECYAGKSEDPDEPGAEWPLRFDGIKKKPRRGRMPSAPDRRRPDEE